MFLHVCAEERWHMLDKFIKELPLIVSFARRRTTNLNDRELLKYSIIEGWELTIPFALVGYEIVNSQLDVMRLVGYLQSRIQRGLME